MHSRCSRHRPLRARYPAMARVLIAVPTFETITPDTFKAIWDMDKGGHECLFEFVRGYDCATARNSIVFVATDLGVDYLMMVDNDVTPPRDALVNMIDDGVDVVSGYYAHRDADNVYRGRTCACKLLMPNNEYYFNYPLESEYTADELHALRDSGKHLVQIHGGGMGCILINMRVFRKTEYPWFDWVNYGDGNWGMLSEDLFFCEQLRKAHVPMHVDTRVACGHLFRRIQSV